jgi:hypothetical protein
LLVQDVGSQAFGSALSYMRRYALTSLLGVAADSDDDANAADGNAAQQIERRPKPPAPSVIKSAQGQMGTAENQPQPMPVGSIPPHELAAPQGNSWVPWGREFLDAVKNAPADDRIAWLSLNGLRIKTLKDEAPKVFERLLTALSTLGIDADIIESLKK